MRILVTGGSGFIGSHVVEKLMEAEIDVRVFDLEEPPFDRPVDMVRGSVTDSGALRRALTGCDAVIHLAAWANVNEVLVDPAVAESVNTRGTLNVLEAARAKGIGRVVFASTTWVYSDCPQTTVDEDTVPAAPSHIYTATKLAGEMYCKAYRELYELDYTILRFGIPYGPRARDGGVVRAFVQRALDGEPLTVAGSGEQSRRFVYVEDLAEGVVRGLRPSAANRVFNLAGSESVSVLQVAETVRAILGTGEIRHTAARPGDFPGKEISTERAKHELGWTASTPFADGVRRYVDWYRAQEQRSVPRRVLILSADIGEGHDLPARAMAADLEAESPGIDVRIEDCLAAMGRFVQFIVKDSSRVVLRWAPWVFGVQYYLLARLPPTRWLSMRLTRLLGSRAILRLVRTHRPDAIVSTYPGSTAIIGELRRRRRLEVPTFSAITDLAGLHYWAHPGIDLHSVTHPESIEEVEQIAGPGSVQWARPPTSPGFLEPRRRAAARVALGLPRHGKVVVVSGGGWGVGDLESAIRASLTVEHSFVVCLCGRNPGLQRRLEQHFGDHPRVALWGFTDQMSELLAAADALIHSTAGLTVLEAIIRGCPVISYGFSAGHIRVNNRALKRFDLAHVARSESELRSVLATVVKRRDDPDLRFAERPSAASLVLRNKPRVQPIPVWRLGVGKSLAFVATVIIAVTAIFASEDSYTLFARALDVPPMTTVATSKPQVALVVDAPESVASSFARRLAARQLHASFALDRKTDTQTVATLRRLGDEPIPLLGPGGPVRWIGTHGQLGRTARQLGIDGHFFYVVPKGLTLGQYLLGHAGGSTAIAPETRFTSGTERPELKRGEIVELLVTQDRSRWGAAVNSLSRALEDGALAALPVTTVAAGG